MFQRHKNAVLKAAQRREDLFLLLDRNHAQYMGDQCFWQQLHALDAEISPGSIRLETFELGKARDLDPSDGGSEMFCKGMPTVVIALKHRNSAVYAAKIFNRIFIGTGTKFVAEATIKDGQPLYQIRSNIDKQHWDKLTVYCHYRFDREIKNLAERKALMESCQKTIDRYVAEYPEYTFEAHWKSLEGVPALITLMGLPGVLRPTGISKPSRARKQAEFDASHPRGTPLVFEGIPVHVEIKSSDSSTITESPYTYGFDAEKLALNDATDGKRYWELLLETCGGNPLAKSIGWTSRAINIIGLSLGGYGLYNGAEGMVGWLGPATSAGLAGSFLVATYVDHKYKILKRLETLRRDKKEMTALENEHVGERGVTKTLEEAEKYNILISTMKQESPYIRTPLIEAIERLPNINQWGERINKSRNEANEPFL